MPTSESNASTLTTVWYLLAKHAVDAEKIYGEVKNVDEDDVNTVATLPHLNGALNEAMRIFPISLTQGTRITPSEGLWIEDKFIPGGTKIAAPRYSIFRRKLLDESYITSH